jgi:hypothetical protein
MTGLPFPWIFIGLAAVVDAVGLLYLWRRRNLAVGGNHRVRRGSGPALWLPLAERRRSERRRAGKAAAV